MNIYFVSLQSIREDSWKAMLDVLNIECVVDLLFYKEDANDPFTSHHHVFDDISVKYNLPDLMPKGYFSYPKEKRLNTNKRGIQKIFRSLVESGIERYKFREPTKNGMYSSYVKDEWNVLVLCPKLEISLIDYCSRYFCDKLFSYKDSRSCFKFIDLYQLDFIFHQVIRYNQNNYSLRSYDSQLWSARRDFNKREVIENDGSEKWLDLYGYNIDANTKYCKILDEMSLKLKNKYQITESSFFKEGYAEKFINARKKYDSAQIEELRKIEEKRMREEMNYLIDTDDGGMDRYDDSDEWRPIYYD